MRFDIINGRTLDNIKTFLLNHVEAETKIINDRCQGYAFLDGEKSVWEHETHINEIGDFGYGLTSTSNMEHTLPHLKN